MGDVVNLSDRKPHVSGPAICTGCEHEWTAVRELEANADYLECPSCRRYLGVLRGPFVPETYWECKCGNRLFYLSPEGAQCRNCGIVTLDWAE